MLALPSPSGRGQEIVALVASPRSADEIGRELRERLPSPSWPRRLRCVPAIPTTPSGKRDRPAILRLMEIDEERPAWPEPRWNDLADPGAERTFAQRLRGTSPGAQGSRHPDRSGAAASAVDAHHGGTDSARRQLPPGLARHRLARRDCGLAAPPVLLLGGPVLYGLSWRCSPSAWSSSAANRSAPAVPSACCWCGDWPRDTCSDLARGSMPNSRILRGREAQPLTLLAPLGRPLPAVLRGATRGEVSGQGNVYS